MSQTQKHYEKISYLFLQIKSVIINIFDIPVSDNTLEDQGLPYISRDETFRRVSYFI